MPIGWEFGLKFQYLVSSISKINKFCTHVHPTDFSAFKSVHKKYSENWDGSPLDFVLNSNIITRSRAFCFVWWAGFEVCAKLRTPGGLQPSKWRHKGTSYAEQMPAEQSSIIFGRDSKETWRAIGIRAFIWKYRSVRAGSTTGTVKSVLTSNCMERLRWACLRSALSLDVVAASDARCVALVGVRALEAVPYVRGMYAAWCCSCQHGLVRTGRVGARRRGRSCAEGWRRLV